jgi:predicted protein tyrosine phosphatase
MRLPKNDSEIRDGHGHAPLQVQPPRPNGSTYWVTESLLAGEYPADKTGEEETRQKLRQYLDCGITSFVDLTHEGEKQDYQSILVEEARRKGLMLDDTPDAIRYTRCPIQDFGIPRPPKLMKDILDTIDRSVEDGHKVYVHCRAGIGRTGTAVGCFLVRRGLNGEQALQEVNRLFQFSDRSFQSHRSPEMSDQEVFVKAWNESIPWN